MSELEQHITKIRLPDGEGSIEVRSKRKLNAEEVAKTRLDEDWHIRLVHSYHCNGKISIQTVSPTKHAIFCEKCFMRFLIPIEVLTLGALHLHIEKKYFEKP